MTTLSKAEVACAVCSARNTVTVIQSLYAGNRIGLDGRPAWLPRNLVALTIHECQACGYCAPDLTTTKGIGAAATIEAQCSTPAASSLPPAARRFCSYADLGEAAGNYKLACWARLNGAWVCDDLGRRSSHAAYRCRQGALKALEELNARNQRLLPHDNFDHLLQLDLWRRTRKFTEVTEAVTATPHSHARFYQRIASFQLYLAHGSDPASYTIGEALAAERPWSKVGQHPRR